MTHNGRSRPAADPMDRLKSEAVGLVGAVGEKAIASLRDRVAGTAGRLADYSHDGGSGGGAGLLAALTGAKGLAEGKSPLRSMVSAGTVGLKGKLTGLVGKDGGGKGSRGKGMKVTNIVEQIDVGAPISLTYDLWTRFTEFPSFMKKVESVEQAEDEQLNWRAQVLWSHRTWEATILEQTPDEKIIWRSKGAKGHVDGAVTFHELAPRLTRILLVLEYHPQGFFEHTGNLWRAPGRRARLELKHFRRHLMSEVLLNPDEIKGWRGVIEDSRVVDDGNDESDADWRGNGDRQDDTGRRAVTGNSRRTQKGRSSPGDDDNKPDRGEHADRARRAEPPRRMERQRRRPQSSSESERARRPTGEPRRAGEPRRTGSGERARGERSGGGAARRSAR